jgi:hypothetical protein
MFDTQLSERCQDETAAAQLDSQILEQLGMGLTVRQCFDHMLCNAQCI